MEPALLRALASAAAPPGAAMAYTHIQFGGVCLSRSPIDRYCARDVNDSGRGGYARGSSCTSSARTLASHFNVQEEVLRHDLRHLWSGSTPAHASLTSLTTSSSSGATAPCSPTAALMCALASRQRSSCRQVHGAFCREDAARFTRPTYVRGC